MNIILTDDEDSGIEPGDRVRYKPDDSRLSQPDNPADDGYVYGEVERVDPDFGGIVDAKVRVDRVHYTSSCSVIDVPSVESSILEVIE